MDSFRHQQSRILFSSPPDPDPRGSDGLEAPDKGLLFTVGTVSLITIVFIILNQIMRCVCASCGRRRPDAALTATQQLAVVMQQQGAECAAQLAKIPLLVYGSLPSVDPSSSQASGEQESCPVCLSEYTGGEEVRVLPRCKHMFHRECIDKWFVTRSSFCPVCRDRVIQREVEPTAVDFELRVANGSVRNVQAFAIVGIPVRHVSPFLHA